MLYHPIFGMTTQTNENYFANSFIPLFPHPTAYALRNNGFAFLDRWDKMGTYHTELWPVLYSSSHPKNSRCHHLWQNRIAAISHHTTLDGILTKKDESDNENNTEDTDTTKEEKRFLNGCVFVCFAFNNHNQDILSPWYTISPPEVAAPIPYCGCPLMHCFKQHKNAGLRGYGSHMRCRDTHDDKQISRASFIQSCANNALSHQEIDGFVINEPTSGKYAGQRWCVYKESDAQGCLPVQSRLKVAGKTFYTKCAKVRDPPVQLRLKLLAGS